MTSTAFGSLICRDRRCCPPEGRPNIEIMSSRTAMVHVLNGETVASSEADLLADVLPFPGEIAAPRPAGAPGQPPEGRRGQWRQQWWQIWTGARAEAGGPSATEPPQPPAPVPGLSAALHDFLLRDAVLMDLLGAPDEAVAAMLAGRYGDPQAGRPVPAGSGPDLGRLLRQPPRSHVLEPGRIVLAGAVRVAQPGDRAPGLAVLALLAWFQGQGGRSRLLAERAAADSRSVSLIGLVEDLLAGQIEPPWHGMPPKG